MTNDFLSMPPELSGISQALGIRRKEWGKGKCTMTVEVKNFHTNKGGVAHGGLYTMMLDSSLGGALVSTLKKDEWCATTQLVTSFIDAAKIGDCLTSSGRIVRRGRNVAHLEGEITTQSGRLIATAKGTWAIWESRPANLGIRRAERIFDVLKGSIENGMEGIGEWIFKNNLPTKSRMRIEVIARLSSDIDLAEDIGAFRISEEVSDMEGKLIQSDESELRRGTDGQLYMIFEKENERIRKHVEEGSDSIRIIGNPESPESRRYFIQDGKLKMHLWFVAEELAIDCQYE